MNRKNNLIKLEKTENLSVSCPSRRVKTNVFTLIELLVVIAIIAILAGILMPALSSARERGRAAVCINNIKSINSALQAYSDDSRGVIIYQYVLAAGNRGWLTVLYDKKYLAFTKVEVTGSTSFGRFNKATYCPSAAFDPPYQTWDKAELRTYGMLTLNGDSDYTATSNSKKELTGDIWFEQQLGSSSNSIRYFKVSNVKSPGSVVYFGETSYRNTHSTALERNRPAWQFQVSSTHSSAPHLKLQHSERANVLFFDGHVAAQDRYQLRTGPMRVKYTNDANGEMLSL